MGCCEKLKYERLKELNHARILMIAEGNLTRTRMALVKKGHHLYGEHYEGIHYDIAVREGLKIIQDYNPTKKVQKKSTAKKPKKNVKSSADNK